MKIAILGYGTEGKSLVKYFRRKKVDITVFDQNSSIEIPKKFTSVLGKNAFEKLMNFDLVFKSPGIPPSRIGRTKNLTSATQYFFEKCPCPIIGVTGTKGKGTTSTLIYEILKAAGYDAYLGGNIGISPLEFLGKLKKTSLVVLELSSFQTQDLTRSPKVAVILNTTSDHMDYHETIKAYHEAKAELLKNQNDDDVVVVNADYKNSVNIGKVSKGKMYTVSTVKNVKCGAQIEDGKIILKNNGSSLPIMAIKKIGLIGPHNLENVLPAALVASLFDVSLKTIEKTVSEFKGLPHRLEYVTTRKKVDYYNDSFSTTPETSMAAIRSFERPIHLIVGGSEKFSDFREWAKVCASSPHVKSVIFTGEVAAPRMEEALKKANSGKKKRDDLKTIRLLNLREAMIAAKTYAGPNDVVLLSPACASFEEFMNYKVRGETFKKLAMS